MRKTECGIEMPEDNDHIYGYGDAIKRLYLTMGQVVDVLDSHNRVIQELVEKVAKLDAKVERFSKRVCEVDRRVLMDIKERMWEERYGAEDQDDDAGGDEGISGVRGQPGDRE